MFPVDILTTISDLYIASVGYSKFDLGWGYPCNVNKKKERIQISKR
jgi:hypothetical protein